MKRPEEVKREFTRQWLRKADEDLATARYLVRDRIELGFAIGFHAQQAVETCLKAVLVWRQVEFTKSHDVDRLLELVRSVDTNLGDPMREAAALSLYAVDARYPGDLPEPTPAEARAALEPAERVRDAVSRALPADIGIR